MQFHPNPKNLSKAQTINNFQLMFLIIRYYYSQIDLNNNGKIEYS